MHRPIFLTPVLVLLLATAGCAPLRYAPSAVDQVTLPEYQDNALQGSLFPADQAVVSNQTIAQILDAKTTVPADARVAVIRLNWPRYHWWSEDLARMDQEGTKRFIDKLEQAPRVRRASYVPAMLMPTKTSVPYLREAAARYQADLIVVYQVFSRGYQRQQFLKARETRAYCVVEAVLIDTRTGLVPFATSATESYMATKEKDDFSFNETIQRAQMAAAGKALDRVGQELVEFLNETP